MSATALSAIDLGTHFANTFPELSVPWRATDFPEPRTCVVDEALAAELGLDPAFLRSTDGARFLTGAALPAGARPVAQAYAGHQFGQYSPILGDGRAVLLGELAPAGADIATTELPALQDLHLKGSGPTAMSRGGDGYAALGPMLREYLVSTAMHALGIPTTRALAVVGTGARVQRETAHPGAVLARVAASHLRVGTFQLAASNGSVELVRRLADEAVGRHHPGAHTADNRYLALFAEVASAQAHLVAQWMGVGFVHGVLNTDNTTIAGQTIDYGPCAFMEAYDPATVFSSIDRQGRYAFGNQPQVMQWNLARFAETLIPLVDDDADRAISQLMEVLDRFPAEFETAWTAVMCRKLGLGPSVGGRRARDLVVDLAELLRSSGPDYTGLFCVLGDGLRGDCPDDGAAAELLGSGGDEWLARWRKCEPSAELMARANPRYIPRNLLVEEALAAAEDGDLRPCEELAAVLRQPFGRSAGLERFARPAPADAAPYVTYCGT